MLRIYSSDDVDLTTEIPVATELSVPNSTYKALLTLSCSVANDTEFKLGTITVTIDWNDGSNPVTKIGNSPMPINETHRVSYGNYIVRVTAKNNALPVNDTVTANFLYVVKNLAIDSKSPVIYGPILPKDSGYPNSKQWIFNTGTDAEILASSLKMLLTTTKGERIELPNYGTNIRSILFEFNDSGVEAMINQEIVDAISTWEPRVSLVNLAVNKLPPNAFEVIATFVNKLNQASFNVALSYV
jgi:phage baseplate assembly protein W